MCLLSLQLTPLTGNLALAAGLQRSSYAITEPDETDVGRDRLLSITCDKLWPRSRQRGPVPVGAARVVADEPKGDPPTAGGIAGERRAGLSARVCPVGSTARVVPPAVRAVSLPSCWAP